MRAVSVWADAQLPAPKVATSHSRQCPTCPECMHKLPHVKAHVWDMCTELPMVRGAFGCAPTGNAAVAVPSSSQRRWNGCFERVPCT